jgi:hypothetical protein
MRRCPWLAAATLAAGAVLAVSRSACASGLFDQPVSASELLHTTLAQPAAELAAARVLSGKFVQRRYLAGLDRPLVSQGDFLLAREQGILWRTTTPFPSEFVLSAGGMTLRDGASTTHLSSSERPALRTALEVLFALFALDVGRLAETFELFGQNQGDHWQVGLRPRDGGLARLFDQAVISGAHTVERIELSSASGDRTEIELSGIETHASALDAGEAARFHP